MELTAKTFSELTPRELYEILKSRAEIFIIEQNINYNDMDDVDYESLHCFFTENGAVTAYLRAYRIDDDTVKVGRVLTLRHGHGLGRELLEKSIPAIAKRMTCKKIHIDAQKHAVGFDGARAFGGVGMKNSKASTYLRLFITFLKIGAFTFGGGYAMIPLIQRETVEKREWITSDDIFEIVAIAESTPGPVAINAATFVGYRICGFFGALMSTLGVVLPSFLIILAISFVLREFESIKVVQYAFSGIRAGVLALIVKAVWSMYKQCPKNACAYAVMLAAFMLTAFFDVDVLAVIIGCALFGLASSVIASKGQKR